MSTALLQTTYFGPIQWYQKLYRYDRCLIEQYDSYQKQTYRNRCVIATANGLQALTVPVEGTGEKCVVRDLRISDHNQWWRVHWNALLSAYNESPFFDYYADDIRPFFEKKYEFLIDFNEALQEMICALIDMQPCVKRTSEYIKEVDNGALDLREVIHPKHDYAMEDEVFKVVPYYQVFQEKLGFIPNLSIVDLLFNLGPESLLLLKQSINNVED